MDLVRARLTGTAAELRELFADLPAADFGCRPVAVRVADADAGTEERAEPAEPRVAAQVLLPRDELDGLRSRRAAVEIEEIEDVTASAEAALGEVSPGGRFAARGEMPTGLGRRVRPDTEG